ncbi:hypothetical protein FRB98_009569 [Tulasnella sp. 332]|nr:hypothetical protein FRB98_009569 [Tulasnella sp. 332]
MRSLSLDGNGLASPPLGSELILLPSLERLSVSRWEDLSALFGKLQMPKLRSLVIDTVCGQRRTSNLAVAFLKLLHPTSPPLIELDLKAAPLSEKELVLTLEKLPALEILRVANTDKISSTFFNALEMERPRSKSRNPWLCPNLRVLEVGKGCERVSEGLIASLVRARVLEISATIVIEEALGRIKGGSNHVKMLEVAMWEGRDMIRREDANPPVQLIAQPRF